MRIKHLFVIPLFLLLLFLFSSTKVYAYPICSDGPNGGCSLTKTTGCTDTNPGICSVSAPGECNICTPGSSGDCCIQPGVSAWSKYAAECVYTDPFSGGKGYVWVYDTAMCSTANKCLNPGSDTTLSPGYCTCMTYGSPYKTCCSGTTQNACQSYSIQDPYPPPEGVCPAGSTVVDCGQAGQPSCGQTACDTLKPNCNTGISCSGSCNPAYNTCSQDNGTQGGCEYTTYNDGSTTCTRVSAPDQSCSQYNCLSGYTCVNGTCNPPSGASPPPDIGVNCIGTASNPCACSGGGCANQGGPGTDWSCCHRTCQLDGSCVTVAGGGSNLCNDRSQCPQPTSCVGTCNPGDSPTFSITNCSGPTRAAYKDGTYGPWEGETAPLTHQVFAGKTFDWWVNGDYKGSATCYSTAAGNGCVIDADCQTGYYCK